MDSTGTKLNLFVISLFVCLAICGCSAIGYPSDHTLEEKFRLAESDFNRLASMFKEDTHLYRLDCESGYSSWDTKTNVPEQRMSEYLKLLSKLEVKGVSRGEKSGDVYLLMWTRPHMLIGSKSKFFIYADTPPKPLVDSLDKLVGGTDAFAYKRISNNWYLLLDVW